MSDYPTNKLFIPDEWNGMLIVGDVPYDDKATAAPFMHSHLGNIQMMLTKSGISKLPGMPAFANVLSFYPTNGYITAANPVQVEDELNQLRKIISQMAPRVILFLGRHTAKAVAKITDLNGQRGAPFFYDGRIPALCTYHPRELFMQYELTIIAIADYTKAGTILKTGGWKPPLMEINYLPSYAEAVKLLNYFIEKKLPLSVDIETNAQLRMTCIGFAFSKTQAICIPLQIPNGRYWPEHEEKQLWRLLAQVCEKCPLIGHYAVHFDHYVLAVKHKILANFVSDTMFGHWEVYCELPKSLAFLNSIYLLHPYWKDVLTEARSGKIPYQEEFRYNAQDTLVCLQSAYEISKELEDYPAESRDHYRFNIRVSRALQYMSIRGMRFDAKKRDERVKHLSSEADLMTKEFQALVGRNINVRSHQQMKKWLYDEPKNGGLGLPPKYKEKKDKETGDKELVETQDYLTLLKLAREFPDIKALMVGGRLRKLLKRISTLSTIIARPDGYVSYSLNTIGTETGRASSSKLLDGTGIQAQNQDRRDRDLYLADEGGYLAKCDLEGADSWTVAAQLSSLGNHTMMEDLLAGLKPAQIMGIAWLFGSHLVTQPAAVIKTYLKDFKAVVKQEEASRGPGRTIYDIMKAGSHGGNYGMGPQTMQDNSFRRSDGELYVPVGDFKRFLALYNRRYDKLEALQEKMASILNTHGYLDSYSGNRRIFLGRRDSGTIRIMLSQLPQNITGFVTNQLLDRVYHWKQNRVSSTNRRLILQPVNQVHDETDLAFSADRLEQAREIFHKASRNRIVTWGVEYSIPFDAHYGLDWSDAKEEF